MLIITCWHRYGNLQIFPSPTEYPMMLRKNCIFPLHAARFGSSPPGAPLSELIDRLCGGDKTILTPWPSPRARVFNGAISCPLLVEFRSTPPPTITPAPFVSIVCPALTLLVMMIDFVQQLFLTFDVWMSPRKMRWKSYQLLDQISHKINTCGTEMDHDPSGSDQFSLCCSYQLPWVYPRVIHSWLFT